MMSISHLFYTLCISTLILSPSIIYSQSDISSEIDQEVWEVFKSSYGNRNAKIFNSIHTSNVLRITPNGFRVGQEYRDSNIKSFNRKGSSARTIDFRFERRIHEAELAYEIGVYQISEEDGNKHYGRFSVLLKKIDGRWLIAQDWDTNDINGHKVGEADWNRLAPE